VTLVATELNRFDRQKTHGGVSNGQDRLMRATFKGKNQTPLVTKDVIRYGGTKARAQSESFTELNFRSELVRSRKKTSALEDDVRSGLYRSEREKSPGSK
jgi:hypothetical protein